MSQAHRVRATTVPGGTAVYLDLSAGAAPAILRGNLNITEPKKVKSKIVQVLKEKIECTHVYTADGKCRYVAETPEDLFTLEPVAAYNPSVLEQFRNKGQKPKPATKQETR
jgi:hypothetical protein